MNRLFFVTGKLRFQMFKTLLLAALCLLGWLEAYAATSIPTADPAVSMTVLHTFDNVDGNSPGELTWANDGKLYGTANSSGGGIIFKFDSDLNFKIIHNFNPLNEGWGNTNVRIAVTSDGSIYGSTLQARDSDLPIHGTIYRIAPDASIKLLYKASDLGSTSWLHNSTFLIRPDSGILYGTAERPVGEYFVKIDLSTDTISYYGFKDETKYGFFMLGIRPGLNLGKDGNFYGTGESATLMTVEGSTEYKIDSTIYKLDKNDFVSQLFRFDYPVATGLSPDVHVNQGFDYSLYGVSKSGGRYGFGAIYKVSTDNILTNLHNFSGTDGNNIAPREVIPVKDGSVYGTTGAAGRFGFGILYRLDANGVFAVLHDFTESEGRPNNLVAGSDGNLYLSTTGSNSSLGYGVVYKINIAQSPSITNLSANPATAEFGNAIALMASVNADSPQSPVPTGNINFFADTLSLGTAPINNGTAILSISNLPVGSHIITAKYVGDDRNAASESNPVNVDIKPLNTAPVALDDNYTIRFHGKHPVIIPAPGLLANDKDAEGNILSVFGATAAKPLRFNLACHKVELYQNGRMVIKPNVCYGKPFVSFRYKVTDGKLVSKPAKITISKR